MAMRLLLHRNVGIFLEKARYACIFKPCFNALDGTGACSVWRISALAVLAVGIWLLSAYGTSRPQPLGLKSPAGQFSAARAQVLLGRLLDGQHPHPAGSAENVLVHQRILKELADLGIPARTSTRMSCFSEARYGALSCGTVTNIVAEVSQGAGKHVVLMAHLDSVGR
jgi:hypothetical protein